MSCSNIEPNALMTHVWSQYLRRSPRPRQKSIYRTAVGPSPTIATCISRLPLAGRDRRRFLGEKSAELPKRRRLAFRYGLAVGATFGVCNSAVIDTGVPAVPVELMFIET